MSVVIATDKSRQVVGEDGKALSANEVGEICLRGPHLMRGYIGNPEATRHAIREDGWLFTGIGPVLHESRRSASLHARFGRHTPLIITFQVMELWNALSRDLKVLSLISAFKRQFKNNPFKKHYQ